MIPLRIIPTEYLKLYCEKIDFNLLKQYNSIAYTDFKKDVFYYNTNSVCSSAKIEGEIANSEDLISYLRHKKKYSKNYIAASNDLYNAYIYAQESKLTEKNILKAHQLLSKNLLQKSVQGKIRTHDEVIYLEDKIIYTATSKTNVKEEFSKLIDDLNTLLNRKLNTKEVFYYAFMLSVVFVKIHPFADGNGRMSRLLEKWFIAKKLGNKAWFIKLELNYYNKRKSYFLALNRMGLFYENTNYAKALNIATYTAKTLK